MRVLDAITTGTIHMSLKHSLIDAFGWNSWEYLNLREPYGTWEYDDNFHEYRICKVTGRFQQASPHCFGLNPPTYAMNWATLDTKPKLHYIDGEWKVK